MSKRWGTPTWYFLHVLAEKIYDNEYVKINKEFINIVVNILNNLPCPICRGHAVKYIKKHNIYKIYSKHEMKMYLFAFHNWVNKRLKHKTQDIKILDLYIKMDTIKVYKYFKQEFFKTNALAKNFFVWHRDSLNKDIANFLNKNKNLIAP